MKRKGIFARSMALFLVLAFVFAVTLAGCGDKKSSGKTDDGEKVYKLKMNVHTPDNIAPSLATKAGCDKATELSKGRLKFDIYYNGNYVSYGDTMMGLGDGTIDMALLDATMVSSAGHTLNQVFNQPIKTTLPDRITISEAYRELRREVPEIDEEFDKQGVHWASIGALTGHNLHTKTKDVVKPEDLKGQKLDSPGDSVNFFNMLDAPSTSFDPGDSYDAISKNLATGQVTHWAMALNFGTVDLLTHHTIFGLDKVTKESPEGESEGGLFAYVEGYGINLDKWNSLPKDLQDILEEAFDFAGDEMARLDYDPVIESKTKAIDRGDKFNYVVGDDLQEWYKWADKSMEKWYKDCETKGFDGKGVYAKMIEKIDKFRDAKAKAA